MRAVVALSLLLPSAAFAQQRPLITISNIPPPYDMLSTEEVIDDPPITLTWQADVDLNQSYIFELTYDTQRDRDPPTNPTLVILDDTPDAHSCLGHEIRG